MSEYRRKHRFVVEQYRQVGTVMTIQLRCARFHRGAVERCHRREYILCQPGEPVVHGVGIVPVARIIKEAV